MMNYYGFYKWTDCFYTVTIDLIRIFCLCDTQCNTFEDDGADCQNGGVMEFDGCTNVFITTANYNLSNSVINYSNNLTENLICNETGEIQDGSVPFSIENDLLRLYQQLPFKCLDGLDYFTVITIKAISAFNSTNSKKEVSASTL